MGICECWGDGGNEHFFSHLQHPLWTRLQVLGVCADTHLAHQRQPWLKNSLQLPGWMSQWHDETHKVEALRHRRKTGAGAWGLLLWKSNISPISSAIEIPQKSTFSAHRRTCHLYFCRVYNLTCKSCIIKDEVSPWKNDLKYSSQSFSLLTLCNDW